MALRVAYDSGGVSFRSLSYLCLFGIVCLHTFCLQNDLVHGWGLDFALRKCVEVLFLPLSIRHCSLENDHYRCQ
jgi:hypothetical protein